MSKEKFKIRIKKGHKIRAPHRPTHVHKDKKKYTRSGREQNRRRKVLLKEWQQMQQE